MVGRTFIQKLGKNELFGSELTDVFWVPKIVVSNEREDLIRDSFVDQEVHFSYPHDLHDFNYLVENFTQDKSEYVDNKLGEKFFKKFFKKSSNFLIVSRKYGFSCLYVFHTIYPGRQNWEMIISLTHIFNFFPGSIHSSTILKTLSLFVSRQKNTYLPNQQIWLNKLYFQISNSKERKCLMIDTRDVNELGSGKFRRSADNREEQTCYFNRNKSDTHFTFFFAKRTQTNPIRCSVVKPNSDLNLSIKALILNLTVQCQMVSLRANINKLIQKTLTMEDTTDARLQSQPMYDSDDNAADYSEEILENSQQQPEKSQKFSQQAPADKIVNRHKIRYTATRIKYSPTRIKSRNFLSNISYTGISKNDFYNENFIFNVYALLVKNLNSFSLSRKVTDKTKHEMVYMLWRECIPSEFYRYICQEKHFTYFNG